MVITNKFAWSLRVRYNPSSTVLYTLYLEAKLSLRDAPINAGYSSSSRL